VRRLRLSLPVLTLFAVLALAGCRTEPAVAAYIGDRTITTDQLEAAVQERMDDPNIAAVVEPGDADYQRNVLSLLIKQVEYRILSASYDVAVSDRDVEVRLNELLVGNSPDEVEALYARIAAEEMAAQIDVRENVRQALIREAVAAEEGLDGPIQETALRERYEEIKNQLSTIEVGLITVPDQETADATLETLVTDPSTYGALAATYAGPDTLPSLATSMVSEVPPELLPSVLQTAVGQGFTVALPGTPGIVVGYVASLDVPPFEEAQEQLRLEAASGVDASAAEIVTQFFSGIDIDINPRYGALDEDRVVPAADGGVVRILEDAGAA